MRENEEMILVESCDAGPGIPADIVENAFNPYFTAKPFGERTGLGLDAFGTTSYVAKSPGRTGSWLGPV